MFDFIYLAIGKVISFFNSITGNYIFALLLFAVVAKLIFIPLDIKQQKNSIKQARLRPKEMAIRNKYKGRTDRPTMMKMQEEIQDLYQKEGYSMFGGCLPLLIQFPIIIILYGVIRQPIAYICGFESAAIDAMASALNTINNVKTFSSADQISMIGNIMELTGDAVATFSGTVGAVVEGFDFEAFKASLPNFTFLNLNLGKAPSEFGVFSVYMLIPLLNFAMQFASTKLMKKFQPQPIGQDESQKQSMAIMEFTLPLMTVYFAYIMNAAIGVYWVFQNVISLVERFIIAKLMPIPTYTEEEIKEIEKAMKNAAKARKAASSPTERAGGEKPRSLHRIDEDDDDEPEVKEKPQQKKIAEPTEEEKKNAAIADKVLGEAPKLKDDSDKNNAKK